MLQYNTLRSTGAEDNSCTQGLTSSEREEMGNGRAERSSAIGDGGQAARSFMPEVDGKHVHIFESSQLEGSYVGNLLYLHPLFWKQCNVKLRSVEYLPVQGDNTD